MRRLLGLLLLAPLLVLLGAGPAVAGSVDEVVRGLERDGVHVDPAAQLDTDEDGIRSAVGRASVPTYVAVLPEEAANSSGGIANLVVEIGTALGDSDAVVLVITDEPFFRADNGRAAGARGIDAGSALEAALDQTSGTLQSAALTALVEDFVDRINAQSRGESGTSGTSDSGGGKAVLALLGVGAVGGGAWWVVSSRRRRAAHAQAMEDARADVESLYGRLGSDVSLLSAGDDDVARQALADAAERYNATGALMSTADSPAEWGAARRTAIEGITAARVARQRLGLDLGPDVPPLPSGVVPQLAEPASVQVGGETFEGSPGYEPGRPHWFEGGYHGEQVVPAGWYATPFWQSILIGSVLGGGRRSRYDGDGGGLSGGFGGGISGGTRWGSGAGRRSGRSGRSGGFGGFGGGGGWGGGGRGGGRSGGGGGSW